MQLSHDAIHWIVIIELKNKTFLSKPTSPRQSPQCISIHVFFEFERCRNSEKRQKNIIAAQSCQNLESLSVSLQEQILFTRCAAHYVLRSDRTNRQNTILTILGEECDDNNIFAFVNAFDVKYVVIIIVCLIQCHRIPKKII